MLVAVPLHPTTCVVPLAPFVAVSVEQLTAAPQKQSFVSTSISTDVGHCVVAGQTIALSGFATGFGQ